MVLEMLNRGIEKIRQWWMAFVCLFSNSARAVARVYLSRSERRANLAATVGATLAPGPAAEGASTSYPPLRDAKLSFYDDFHIISGVPVFSLNLCKESSLKIHSRKHKSWKKDVNRRIAFSENSNSVISCAYSLDESTIATGHNDGSVRVWSAEHGTLIHAFEEMYQRSPVADIRFLKDSNTVVVSSDFHGQYIVWDTAVEDQIITHCSCKNAWEIDSFISPTICWPFFSEDGTQLVYPVVHYCEVSRKPLCFESCCSLCIFTVQDGVVSGCYPAGTPIQQRADRILKVRVKKKLNFAWSGFSHSKKSLLAGFDSSPNGFCILWTGLGDKDSYGVELDGTLGCWSQDDEYVATWDIATKSAISNEVGLCYVWKLADFEKRVATGSIPAITTDQHTERVNGTIVLRDPNGGSVFWAEFITNLNGSLGMATCVIKNKMEVLLWQIDSQTVQHRLSTGILAMDTSLTDLKSWDNRWVHIQHAYGLKPLSISGDGHWLGVYSASAQKGILWNVWNGTEVLNFSVPHTGLGDKAIEITQMDMKFAKSGGSFLLCGEDIVLVWSVQSLGNNEARKGVNRVALKCKDDSITSGKVVCRFCQTGMMVGICRSYSLMINLWHLDLGWEKTLAVEEDVDDPTHWDSQGEDTDTESVAPAAIGRRFCLFAFSRDGSRIATCMGDLKILIWTLGSGREPVSQPNTICDLRSKYLPAWDVCFTPMGNGKEILVACEDLGVLVWIDIETKRVLERQNGFGYRRARFSQDGTQGVLMPSNDVVHVWDLVKRVRIQNLSFQVWMGLTGPVPFPQNISMDGQFAVVGVREGDNVVDHGLVKCFPTTTTEDLENLHLIPRCVEVMERSEWAVLDFGCGSSVGGCLSGQQQDPLNTQTSSIFKYGSFRVPSAAQMHQMFRRSKCSQSLEFSSQPGSMMGGSSLGESKSTSNSLEHDTPFCRPNMYPRAREKQEHMVLPPWEEVQPLKPDLNSSPPLKSPVKTHDEAYSKMSSAHESSSARFPDVAASLEDTAWTYLLEYDEPLHHEASSLSVVHVNGSASPKVLEGQGLLPHKFIATSANGCRVACLSSDNTLMVWTAFATQHALPDWNDLLVSKSTSDRGTFMSMLDTHGPAIINFPDCQELSIPFHALLAKDHATLETAASWAVCKNVKMGLTAPFAQSGHETKKINTTVLDLGISLRSPECVEILMNYVPRGLGTSADTAFIYKQSLSKLSKIFPNVFNKILTSDALLVSLPEIQVPETLFSDTHFKVMTTSIMFPSQEGLQRMWNKYVKKSQKQKLPKIPNLGPQAKMIPAVPKVVLYPDLVQVGKQGLLRRLVVLGGNDDMYSSFVLRVLIHCKWKIYAYESLLEEIWMFALLWVIFVSYALILGGTWHLVTFHELLESSNSSEAHFGMLADVLLMFAWLLACMALTKEVTKILHHWIEDGFAGLYFWGSHMFNYVLLVSYIILVVFIGPLHLYIGLKGDVANNVSQRGQKHLTVLVAVESILLSWKIQSFAQAFRSTAAIIIMIREIIKGTFKFLIIAFLLLSGFALGFYVLFRVELQSQYPPEPDSDGFDRYNDFHQRFGTIFLSMVTVFTMMLGETQIEIFSQLTGAIRVVGTLMCLIYLLAMLVILLNLLIAVMGDCFERVKNNEANLFLKGRSRIILELESMMSDRSMQKIRSKIGRYMHVLVPKASVGLDENWQGRMIEQNELFKVELKKAVEEMKNEFNAKQDVAVDSAIAQDSARAVVGATRSLRGPPSISPEMSYGALFSRPQGMESTTIPGTEADKLGLSFI